MDPSAFCCQRACEYSWLAFVLSLLQVYSLDPDVPPAYVNCLCRFVSRWVMKDEQNLFGPITQVYLT